VAQGPEIEEVCDDGAGAEDDDLLAGIEAESSALMGKSQHESGNYTIEFLKKIIWI